jgi:hypothetical protein
VGAAVSTTTAGITTSKYYSDAVVHTAATLIATDVHPAVVTNYYNDVFTFNPIAGHTITLNVHYGA